jgi:hypothetical protein
MFAIMNKRRNTWTLFLSSLRASHDFKTSTFTCGAARLFDVNRCGYLSVINDMALILYHFAERRSRDSLLYEVSRACTDAKLSNPSYACRVQHMTSCYSFVLLSSKAGIAGLN